MSTYSDETYGERIAGVYDGLYSDYDPAMITALHELAHGGAALELGIGTGRIAIPLQSSGVYISGIDASPAMVERLRAKPGGENIPVQIGSFAEIAFAEKFELIYVVFNTFFALLTQAEQVRCFENAARNLTPTGVFVIEAFVPDLARFTARQVLRAVDVDTDLVRIDVTQHNPVSQQLTSSHITLAESGIQMYPVKLRYAWPSEMDLMARLAGLRLQQRWGGWGREPFSPDSVKHISVYSQV